MPWHIEKRNGKHCVIKDSDNSSEGCHGTEEEAKKHMSALYASENKETPVKVMDGVSYPASDFACVPDKTKPSTWQLRLSEGKPGNITVNQLGRAVAALGKGFRGNKVDLACSRSSVVSRIRSEYRKLGKKPEDMPDEIKERSPRMTVFKDSLGRWQWYGAVSNNYLDDDWPKKEIISAQAHRNYVKAIDDGTFTEKTGLKKPQHWVFHIPVPIGEADNVAYDERGFLIAAGHGYEGEFYDAVYEKLSRAPDMAMSHQMPGEFLQYNKEQDNIIDGYLSIEFTSLPKWAAANKRTVSAHGVAKGDIMPLQIEDGRKRDWFMDTLGEELVREFDNRLSAMAEEAERNGVPSKEIGMSEELERENPEGAPVEEAEVITEATTEVVETEIVGEKADQVPPDSGDEESEEDNQDKPKKEVYVTQEQLLEQVIPEIVKGVTSAIGELNAKIDKELSDLKSRLDKADSQEAEQIKQIIEETPFASISSLFAKSAIGSAAAQVDYNKERTLHQDGPEETDSEKSILGLPGLDEQIRGSRKGNMRVIPGPMFRNGQTS